MEQPKQTNAGGHHEKENPRHKVKQVGMVVGCLNCDYTLFTVMNTEHEKEWEKDKENFMSNNFSEMLNKMTEEEKSWRDRPIVMKKRRVRANSEMKKKQEFAREILNATKKVYPCKVRMGSWGVDLCPRSFEMKGQLRAHLINDHTDHEVENAAKYGL